MFQRITEVFHLNNLIATTAEGTIFQFAFCLLLYNLTEIIRRYLAAQQKLPVEKISLEQLFYDVQRQLIAWSELTEPAATVTALQPFDDPRQLRRHLKAILAPTWTDRWLKAPPKKHAPKRKSHDSPAIPGAHTSLYRLLRASTTR